MNPFGYFGSYEMIGLGCFLSILLALLTDSDTWIYLICGVVLPLIFVKYGSRLTNYWEIFCLLLLVRQFTTLLSILDVLFVLLSPSC